MQFLGVSFGKQFHDFWLVEWQLLCCSTHVIYRFYFVTMFWGVTFSDPCDRTFNLLYLVCAVRAHDCISTKSRGFVSKNPIFAPATSESEKNIPSQKKTVAAMNHGNVGIPPFAFLVVLLIKWGFFAPTDLQKTHGYRWSRWLTVRHSRQGVMITGASEAWSTSFYPLGIQSPSLGASFINFITAETRGKILKHLPYHSQKVSKGLTICESFFCHWWLDGKNGVFFLQV